MECRQFLASVCKALPGVEIEHAKVTACHLSVIAYRMGRKINWDARNEMINGDAQAMTARQCCKPYILPEI